MTYLCAGAAQKDGLVSKFIFISVLALHPSIWNAMPQIV